METSILQQIKNKAGRLIELQLLKTGRVLEVRAWESSAMIEIDLHLPFADIQHWIEVPYIKFRVGNLSFRDYTPFGWDAETNTCSLLVDTAHEGPGSEWAKRLRTGDRIQYLKIESTHQSPHPTDFIVALGDASSLGHLLAMQQLTLPSTRFDGAVLLDNPHTGQLFKDYFSSPVTTLTKRSELISWLKKQSYNTAHTWFYLVGNQGMVAELRTLLRSLGLPNTRVKGFWS
ncbi:hypothetical protein TH53_22135 [Pedobacter lusitanus]|uniref:FAD-binding FR-type domain-containing protein n=1 Tax=Pedobacter lusitanus TaxID=1503925 RepID=A0A0D0FRS7_9SPHI|nr:hypothetical protein [Pedobacter lusitanus]KIO75179.1 hypothetical protein TH53_22135 [Pedobacter lusitanus]